MQIQEVFKTIEGGELDGARFQAILARHGMVPAWEQFEGQFLAP